MVEIIIQGESDGVRGKAEWKGVDEADGRGGEKWNAGKESGRMKQSCAERRTIHVFYPHSLLKLLYVNCLREPTSVALSSFTPSLQESGGGCRFKAP